MYKRRFVFTDKVIWTGRNAEVGREALWRQTSLETLYWRTEKNGRGEEGARSSNDDPHSLSASKTTLVGRMPDLRKIG